MFSTIYMVKRFGIVFLVVIPPVDLHYPRSATDSPTHGGTLGLRTCNADESN